MGARAYRVPGGEKGTPGIASVGIYGWLERLGGVLVCVRPGVCGNAVGQDAENHGGRNDHRHRATVGQTRVEDDDGEHDARESSWAEPADEELVWGR